MKFQKKYLSLLVAIMMAAGSAQADDQRASLEVLRQTTLNLINALVDSGAITREKADELIRKAEQDAATAVAQKKPDTSVRVQYVPEVVKSEMREQIKQEVLAQAKSERWAAPNSIPEWLDRIKWEGDLRLRDQLDRFDKDNATPFDYANAAGTNAPPPLPDDQTRAVDLARVNDQLIPIPTANTTENRDRLRVRARIGMLANISDSWSGGLRLATGNATDRVSTNQTLGQDFNKYSILVDRAYIKFDPTDWLSMTGGRIPNPWFSTDLVWDEDLGFEGIAATFRSTFSNNTVKPFLTLGAFPLKEDNPPVSNGRWMQGVQGGTQWDFSSEMRLKLGLAWYDYKNLEGEVESADSLDTDGDPVTADYGQYAYGSGLRQKGNSLFITNALGDSYSESTSYWGLASKFRPINLTASLDLAQFAPVHVVLTGDWVKNTAFDRAEIFSRTQGRINLTDGNDHGYQYKLTLGMVEVKKPHDWQVSVAYRYLGSDAVLDAFTDSDFGLGGTNLKGYILGVQYGLDRNSALNLRWLSADSIDSFSFIPEHKFAVDLFQADVIVKF